MFLLGVAASLVAMGIWQIGKHFAWPYVWERLVYRGVRVSGWWEIVENREGGERIAGKLQLEQLGRKVSGTSTRSITRDGKSSDRKFSYSGSIQGHQVTLTFEDQRGIGFDVGTYVFIVQNDGNTMIGMATFHGKTENKIVSEPRMLRKVVG